MSDELVERFRDEVRLNLGEHLGDDSVGETLQADIHAALDLIDHLRAELSFANDCLTKAAGYLANEGTE